MRLLLFLSVFALIFGCGKPGPLLKLADETDLPSTFSYEGVPQEIRSWQDLNGKNILLLTEQRTTHRDHTESVNLFGYHVIVKPDTFEVMRKIRRKERRCQSTNRAGFSKDILLTDLDGDQVGEITFAHYGGCSVEVEPRPIRLVMIEEGKIFIIRGTTRLASGEGGRKRVEYSFFFCPPEFLNHANHVWRSFSTQRDVSI